MMNKKLLAAMIAASAALTGCGSSSDSSSETTNTLLDQKLNVNPLLIASKMTSTDGCVEFGGNMISDTECALPSRITTTGGSFDAAITYKLSGLTFLGYGDVKLETQADVDFLNDNPIELTIPAGTDIRGNAGSAFVVTRGAKLDAQGTVSSPIIFEGNDDGLTGSSEWGGLVLQGFGVTNQCPDAGICNVQAEGGVGYYGGVNNADSSGSLKYVVVTEGGFEISSGNELNGVGFMGVGSGTTVDYLQVNENSDDGVEFWGGAVVVKHLVLTANDDDSIDWDNGWVGGVQYAIVKQANGDGDHVFETDNDGSSMDAEPRSMPTIANVTAITGGNSAAVKHREGTGAKFFNVAIVEQGTASKCLDIDHQPTADQIDTGLIYSNVVLGCQTLTVGDDEVSTGVDFAQTLLDSQVSTIETNSAAAVDADYVVTGATAIATAPSIANSAISANTVMGAVENAADDWFAGWTIAGSL